MKMKIENSKLLVFLTIIAATVVVAIGDLFDYNLVAYSACEINFFDKSLFTNNIDVSLNTNSVSPRISNFYIFYALMNLGLSYESSYLVIYMLTCLLTAMALFAFVLKESYSNDYLIVLLTAFVFIFSSIGISSGFGTFAPRSLFLGLGAAFFLCALVSLQLLKGSLQINVPFIFVSLATLAHVHEGIWGLVVITLVTVYLCGLSTFRSYGLYVSIAILLFLTIPSVISGGSSITSDVFYEEYAVFRASHHLLFWKSFPYQTIPSVIEFMMIIYLMKQNGLDKKDIDLAKYAVIIFFSIVLLWYITTELIHSQFFMKMYIPKCFKNINILFTLLLCKTLSKGNYSKMSLLFLLTSVLMPYHYKEFYFYWIPELLIFVFINKYVVSSSLKNAIYGGLIMSIVIARVIYIPAQNIYIVLLVTCLGGVFDKKKLHYIIPAAMSIFLCLYCCWIKDKNKSFADSALEYKVGKDIYSFGKAIANYVPVNKIILMDSRDKSSGFIQHISRRDAYVLFKAAPSNVQGIDIWYHRIKEIEDMKTWDASRYAEFMKSRNLDYLVLKSRDYNSSFLQLFEEKYSNKEYLLLERKT